MKISITGALAMLVCLIMASTALAQCPPGINCIEIYDGAYGEVIGDDSFVTENSLDDYYNDGIKASITNGIDAKINIPAGVQGIVNLAIDRSSYQEANPTLNGEQYCLSSAFAGMIKLGAEKTSNAGAEIAHAKIFAKASADNGFSNPDVCPTCKKDLLSGEATITADVKSTGTGASYAIVEPSQSEENEGFAVAEYNVKRTCPTCPNINKEVAGVAAVREIALETCNIECIDGICTTPLPTGTKTATATVTASSNANNYQSKSTADVKLDVAATRTKKGFSGVAGNIYDATANSVARDGSAPLGNTNWNAQSLVQVEDLNANAFARAANDNAKANGLLHSEATNDQDKNTNTAYNKAEVYSAVKRSDLNNPYTYASAAVNLNNAYFSAEGRNLKASNKYAFERATIATMQSAGQLGKVSNIWSKATLQLTAKRTGTNSLAKITNDVANYGPKTGYATDISEVHEDISNLRAEAKSTSETRFVDIESKLIDSTITGQTTTPSAPDNQAIISGITTSPSGATSETAKVQTQKVGVNNIWKLTFLESND